MQRTDIEMYLAKLGQELQSAGLQQPVRVLLVGGAFMLTQVGNRASTQDIDVVLKDVVDTTASTLYHEFKAAIRAVARKNNLPDTWLNDIISDFLLDIGNVPEGILWKRYDALEVYLPSKDYILALKLLAGRPKDRDDIISLSQLLQIKTREQAQQLLDRYIPEIQIQQMNYVDETLDEFF